MTSALSLIARVGSFTCVLLHLQAIGSSHSLPPTCWSFFCLDYRPQRSCGKVMISQASVQTPPRQTPPWEDTPEDRHPPPGRHPRRQTPPTRHTPLPGQTPPWAVHVGYIPPAASAADSTHLTGMHSCLYFLNFFILMVNERCSD